MAPKPFPTWRYHRSGATRLCHTPEQVAALGPEWSENPGVFEAPPTPAPGPPDHVQYQTSVPAMVAQIAAATVDQMGVLREMRTLELGHPKKPRKAVLTAIDDRVSQIEAEQVSKAAEAEALADSDDGLDG